MIDNTIYMGVNAPRPHQRVIGKLMTALGNLFYLEGKIPYEPFPEMMVDEGKTSPTPDISLYDNQQAQNVVILEISTSVGMKSDFEKIVQLMHTYDVQEGFVYDYVKKKWRKYKLGIGEITDQPSFCESIGYDLNTFVN